MVVARGSRGQAHEVGVFVNTLDESAEYRQELEVLHGSVAGVEEVLSVIGGHRPVVVLARAVYALEWLLMEQAYKSVAESHLLHYLHCELVLVRAEVGRREYRRHLVLCRSYLVVLGLGVDAELPELLVELRHICGYSRLEVCEVLVVEVLSLRRLCSEKRTSCEDKVLAAVKFILINEEIFLLGAYCRGHACDVLVAEQLQEADCHLAESVHRAEQRCLLVESLARI